jgi:hypothetical protein
MLPELIQHIVRWNLPSPIKLNILKEFGVYLEKSKKTKSYHIS